MIRVPALLRRLKRKASRLYRYRMERILATMRDGHFCGGEGHLTRSGKYIAPRSRAIHQCSAEKAERVSAVLPAVCRVRFPWAPVALMPLKEEKQQQQGANNLKKEGEAAPKCDARPLIVVTAAGSQHKQHTRLWDRNPDVYEGVFVTMHDSKIEMRHQTSAVDLQPILRYGRKAAQEDTGVFGGLPKEPSLGTSAIPRSSRRRRRP